MAPPYFLGARPCAQCRVEVEGVYWQGLVLKSSLCSIQEMQKHHLFQVWCLWTRWMVTCIGPGPQAGRDFSPHVTESN